MSLLVVAQLPSHVQLLAAPWHTDPQRHEEVIARLSKIKIAELQAHRQRRPEAERAKRPRLHPTSEVRAAAQCPGCNERRAARELPRVKVGGSCRDTQRLTRGGRLRRGNTHVPRPERRPRPRRQQEGATPCRARAVTEHQPPPQARAGREGPPNIQGVVAVPGWDGPWEPSTLKVRRRPEGDTPSSGVLCWSSCEEILRPR